jgi:hypothetical protein
MATLALAACGKGDGKGGKGGADQEAQVQLKILGDRAKKEFMRDNAFPAITVGPTPSKACCDQPDKVCAPAEADWNGTDWEQLHFKVTDPSHFQYSYTSDGKTFTATAVGDPACDGHKVTWSAIGSVTGGEPTIAITNAP